MTHPQRPMKTRQSQLPRFSSVITDFLEDAERRAPERQGKKEASKATKNDGKGTNEAGPPNCKRVNECQLEPLKQTTVTSDDSKVVTRVKSAKLLVTDVLEKEDEITGFGGPGMSLMSLPPVIMEWLKSFMQRIIEEFNKMDVIICEGRSVPWIDFRKILVTRAKRQIESKQHPISPSVGVARDLYEYFVLNNGLDYWYEVTKNDTANKLDVDLRRGIAVFISRTTSESRSTILTALRDVGKQKRKNRKQKLERQNQQHICERCELRFKSLQHRNKHQQFCKRKNSKRILINESKNAKYSTRRHTRAKPKSQQIAVSSSYTGLEVKVVENKSHALFTRRVFLKNEIVCDYGGELIEGRKNIESLNLRNENAAHEGTYIYEFSTGGKHYVMDATYAMDSYGRYASHSKKKPNAKMIVMIDQDNRPRLVLKALCNLDRCSEVFHDYGDRSPAAVKSNTWLKT